MRTQNHSKGQSRRCSILGKIRERARRFLSLALSVSMVMCSMPTIPAYAAPINEDDDVQEFTLTSADISAAIRKAMDGEPIEEGDYGFAGAARKSYEELFYGSEEVAADLYELFPKIEKDKDGSLSLRVFLRIDLEEDRELDSNVFTGEEELVFLLLNNSKEEQTARIYVDENMSGLIDVAPRKEVILESDDIADTTEAEAEAVVDAAVEEDVIAPSGTAAPAGGGAGGSGGGSGASDARYEADEAAETDEVAEDDEDSAIADEADDTADAEAAEDSAAEADEGSDKADDSSDESDDAGSSENEKSSDAESSSDDGNDSADSSDSDSSDADDGSDSDSGSASEGGSDSGSSDNSDSDNGSGSDNGSEGSSSDGDSDSDSSSDDASEKLSYSNHRTGLLTANIGDDDNDDDEEPEEDDEDPADDDSDDDETADDDDSDADIVIEPDEIEEADEGEDEPEVEVTVEADDDDDDSETTSYGSEDDDEADAEDIYEAETEIQIEPEEGEAYITVDAVSSDEDVSIDSIIVVASDSNAEEIVYKLVPGEVLDPVIVKNKKNKTFAGVAYTAKIADILNPAEGDTLMYEGEDYSVKVTYGDDALLPYGVTLEVSEYDKDSDTYRERILEAAEMYGWDEDEIVEELNALDADDAEAEEDDEDILDQEDEEGSYYVDKVRIFDISLYVDDEIVEPAADVEVEFTFEDKDDEAEYKIIHFMDDDENEEIDTETSYEGDAQVVTFSISAFSDFMVVDSGIMPLDDEEADLEIAYAGIQLGASGTAPFDENDDDGNDSSATNDIIRSFDRATYNMVLDIDSKTDQDASAVRIHFEVNIQGSDIENEFYTQGFGWADHYEVTETNTGHTITGYYDYKQSSGVTGGEISGLSMVIQVLAMSDGMILQPTGKVWLEDLDENENPTNRLSKEVELNFPALEISAKLQLNVYLYQGGQSQTSVEGTFDFASNGVDSSYINYDKGQSIYGRTYGYGITLEMYNNGPTGKGMKGQALPDGDKIYLSIDLNSTFDVATDYGGQSLDLSTYDNGNYQLLFYALEGNTNNNSTCADERSLISIEGDHPSEYYSNHVPYNKGTSSQLGITGVEDGGNWKAVSQTVAEGGTTVNIEVDSYKITQLLFPYAYPNNSNATDGFYTKDTAVEDIDRAVFSAGELWVIQPYSYVDSNGVTQELRLNAGKGTFTVQVKDGVVNGTPGTYVGGSYDSYDSNVQRDSDGNITSPVADENGNINYGTKQTRTVDTQVHNSDDSRSQTAEINPPGTFQNKIKYISTAKKNGYTNVQGVLGDTSGTSYATLGYDDVSISGGLQYTPNTKSNISAALNAVIKFDANALSIKDDDWLSFVRYDGLSNNSNDYNIFFGYLPSGENWGSDTEMQQADEDDLTWYSERQSGKLCVAVLFEYRKPGTTTGDTRLRPSMAMNVLTDPELAGNVFMTTEVTRVWTVEDVADIWNSMEGNADKQITYNDVIDDESYEYINAVIPSAADNYYVSHSTNELPDQSQGYGSGYSYNTHQTGTIYQKTSYNDDGTRTGHNGGDYYGDSLLILSYTSDVNLRIAQTATDQQDSSKTVDKSIYNFDNAERIADLEVTGSMEIQESADTESWGDTIATITVTLPEGAVYKQGSAAYGLADNEGNFTITYVPSSTQGQGGSVSGGTTFESTTSASEYEAWLSDPTKTGGMLYISTDASGNQILTFSVKGVPIQGTDVVRIYFSVELGDESDPEKDLANNSSLTFDATIRTTEDSDRETSGDNGNEDTTTILISRTGSNTFTKYTPTALLNEVDNQLTWVITWDNTSQNDAATIELLDDMPDTKESYSDDYPYASDYHGTYAITGFQIDLSQISAEDAQKLVIYYTMDSQYEGDELVLEHDGDESKLDITWEEIEEKWSKLTINEEGEVDFSSIYEYEYDSTGEITRVTNHVYAWAIGGTVPASEGVHITLTITQYGGAGGDYMTNVAYDSTGNSVFHRSSTVYKALRKITGTVWLDEDMDGGIDTGAYNSEKRIEGAYVQLQVKDGSGNWEDAYDVYNVACYTHTQEGTGYYEFSNLAAGTYRVIFSDRSGNVDPNYTISEHVLTQENASGISTYYNSKAKAADSSDTTLPTNAVAVIDDIVLPELDDMSIYEHTYTEAYQNAGFTKAQTLNVSKTWINKDDEEFTPTDDLTATAKITIKDINWPVTLSEDNNWEASIDILYYDGTGNQIKYELNNNIFITESGLSDGYVLTGTTFEQVEGEDGVYTVALTNSYATTEVSGKKTWDDANDQDGKRPTSITINLLADGKLALDQNGDAIKAVVTATDDWSWSFTDLPKFNEDGTKIIYTITEDTVEDYTTVIDGYDVTNGYIPEKISVEGTKTWEDNNDQDGERPGSITIHLYADGTEVDSIIVTAADEWKWSFTGLNKYRDGGIEIVYTVTEEKITTGDYSTTVNGYDITNTHTPEQTSLHVQKFWNDDNDRDGKRPENITVTLTADGEETDQTLTLNEENGWSGNFTELDKYEDGGTEIEYSISEKIDGYNYEFNITNIDGTATVYITNTHVIETTQISGEKIWDDSDNQDGIRPESITIHLMADGEAALDENNEAITATVTTEDDWAFEFTDLPKYHDHGEEIVYTVLEDALDGYEVTYATPSDAERTVINTHTPETIDITVEKIWDENNEGEYNHIPESIQVMLIKDGEETDNIIQLTETDGWKGSFTGLDKYRDAGTRIKYTVKEVSDEALQYFTPKITYDYEDNNESKSVTGATILNQREYYPIDEEIVPDHDDRTTWVKEESVNEYNAIEIEMSTNIPLIEPDELANGQFTMNFHEILDSELILDELESDFSVYIEGREIPEDFYEVTIYSNSDVAPMSLRYVDTPSPDGLGCTFHVDVDLTALYLDGQYLTDEDLDGTAEIMIFFFADLEGTDLNGSYTSTVWYDVYDGDEWQYTSNVDVVTVYTYEIDILKYDTLTGKGVAGATLGVFYDEDCTDPVSRNNEPYEVVSDEDGNVVFYGLAEGTYYVKETAPSDSYFILSDEVITVELGEGLSGRRYYGEYANDRYPGDLTISKTVTGNAGNTNKDFTFDITLSEEISGTYEAEKTNADGTTETFEITFVDGKSDSFTLKHNEHVTIKDLPQGIIYTVTESDNTGYTVSVNGNNSTLSSDGIIVAFTNYSNRSSGKTPGGGGSGGGSGSGGSGGGSGAGGPGSSGGSEGEGDTWDLLPLSQTGEGRAMLFGGIALAVSAMALIVLLFYKRRESRK